MLVTGKHGMVSSAHSEISETGLKILKEGGNAIDASVAMALTAGVALPDMCSIGGDAFLLYYNKKQDKVYALNGSGEIASRYPIDVPIQTHGMTSVSVPGCVNVLFTALDKWGTMPFHRLSTDAINYSRYGIHVSSKVVRHMKTELDTLKNYPSSHIYLNNGQPKTTEDIIINEDYAKSLEYLNQHGVDGFYKGDIAKKIVAHSHQHGGYFELDDFENYHCEQLEPISIDYRGYQILQTPPVSQGYLHLLELGILNHFDMATMSEAERLHLLIETKKIAFSHREEVLSHLDEALSTEYTKKLASEFNPHQANNTIKDPFVQEKGHTTSFVVVDKFGNACSFILSIAGVWGSMEMVEGTGILLNNRAGVGLTAQKDHPNNIQKRRKAIHTLNTWMIFKDKKLHYVGNTPGGDYQVMWNMQLVSHLIDEKMNAFDAVDTIKWRGNYQNGHHFIELEKNIEDSIIQELERLGQDIHLIEPYSASGASEIIQVFEDHLEGGCDPRSDGRALSC